MNAGLALLLALTCSWMPARTAGYADRYANRDLTNTQVGDVGPMNTGNLQAGTAQTCNINAAAANGYTPGQTYTISVAAPGQHVIHAIQGTIAGNNYNAQSYQWTAPNSASGSASATFKAICATSRTSASYLDTATVQSGGGGGGGGGSGNTPPAKCSSITNPSLFCANYGNSGLISAAASTDCADDPCTQQSDGRTCCQPSANAAKCDTIINPSIFCSNYGNNGLIAAASTTSCASNQCSASLDGTTCCAPAEGPSNIDGDSSKEALKFGEKITVTVTSNPGTRELTFTVKFQGLGWFGIGVSTDGSMDSAGSGSDVFICDDSGVKRHWITTKDVPTGSGAIVVGASCTLEGGISTMVFTRSWDAQSSQQRPLLVPDEVGKSFDTLIWAYHDSQRSNVVYHSERGSVNVDLAAAVQGQGAVTSVALTNPFVWAHGVCMLLAWGLLLPGGITIAHFNRSKDWWFSYHKGMQYTGWFLQLAGFGIIAYYKGANQFKGAGVGLLHMIVGGFVTLLGTAQPLNACCRPHPHSAEDLASFRTQPTPCNDNRKCWEFLHKGIGYLAAIGGFGNLALAVVMVAETHGSQDTMVVIAAGFTCISLIVILFYSCTKLIEGDTSTRPSVSRSQELGSLQQKQSLRMSDSMNPSHSGGADPAFAFESGLGAPPDSATNGRGAPSASGWTKHLDPETGDYYYFNSKTGTVTWDDPDGAISPRSKSENREKNAEPAQLSRKGTVMPPGWTSAISNSTGQKYYVKPNGEGTQWEKPPGN